MNNEKENTKKYNIGLDIGTHSVGWAIVEPETQKIIRKGAGNKRISLWGVRLFDEATRAEERRTKRSTRRRYNRRRNRIKFLQEEFKDEIMKVDPEFFKKLSESKYSEKDKVNKTIMLTTSDKEESKKYNDKYKTIYHLRNELINSKEKMDIRLVYLAVHHIIKYRGNFLYSFEDFNSNKLNIEEQLNSAFDLYYDLLLEENEENINKDSLDLTEIAEILLLDSKNDIKTKLKEELKNVMDKNTITAFSNLVCGNKFNIAHLFKIEESSVKSIDFSSSDYDDKYDELSSVLGDKIELLDSFKNLYDSIFLKKMFKGSNSENISSLMVERYNTHSSDLKLLKELLKNDRKEYNKFFKSKKEKCIYDKYIHNEITTEDLKKEIESIIKKVYDKCDTTLQNMYTQVLPRIENQEFLPRITSKENGKYPYQLNKKELIKIIENQGEYYQFLKEKVGGKYKLVKLLEFRIPYYVGPLVLDDRSEFAWIKRNSNEKITPYNFDIIVNKEDTAEKFITKMSSRCTYLLNEYALPNNSILYSRFKVMNELKQIKINGDRIPNEIQHKIMEELFMKTSGTITETKFKTYLYSLSDYDMFNGEFNITGYSSDKKFANNMQSYIDFFGEDGIFANTSYTEEDAENIIKWITIYSDKDILESRVIKEYPGLEEKIKLISNKNYSGWGSLSKKLLTTQYYCDKENFECKKSILDLMYETKYNFMEIIFDDKYNFEQMIKENNILKEYKLSYDLVDNLACSPAVKRGIYQSLKVVKELTDYMGGKPENIIIEMARGEEKVKKRKDDRKQKMINLYESIKNEVDNYNTLIKELKSQEKLDSQAVYLYFKQEGKCLYCGKSLNILDLDKDCEIDHIIPRSLYKDDSFDNKALVCKCHNQDKANSFVVPEEYRRKQKNWWEKLKKAGLISPKKHYNLNRKEFTDEDIKGFINRQLVETRQITKHVANILGNLYNDSKIIYLKAELSHNYRERYELFKFRDINDYHHAHDAYLAAVLGEYKENHLKKDIDYKTIIEINNILKQTGNKDKLKYGYVINSLDENTLGLMNKNDNGEVKFDSIEFNKRIENTLYRNDILISKKTEIRTGQLYKEKIYKRHVGTIPIKKNMPVNTYGGYHNMNVSYLCLVEYKNKYKLIGIPMQIALFEKNNINLKFNYIKEQLELNDFEKFIIIKDHIPFETFVKFKNHDIYIKGYSVLNKSCEVSNAIQLKINKSQIIRWKYTLNYLLNNKIKYENKKPVISNDDILEQSKEIIEFLYEQKIKFPFFKGSIEKIENIINLSTINIDDAKKIIIQLLTIYKCNSANGNLKEYGLGDRIGRLSGKDITSGTFKFTSITGIYSKEEVIGK